MSAERDLLAAVLDAVAIPAPATLGDVPAYERILLERVGHVRAALTSALDDPQADPDRLTWTAGYLRERLAETPPTGYQGWQL